MARFTKTPGLRIVLLLGGCVLGLGSARAESAKPFRPPSVPLITSDPYLSIWSDADHLTDDTSRHWTRKAHPIIGLIQIDQHTCRLIGNDPADVPAFPQTALRVLPTRSIYDFDDGHVHVTLTFMSPRLPHDLDALALPLSYVTWSVRSVDHAEHKVRLYCSASSLISVDTPTQKVAWKRSTAGSLTALRVGTVDQTYFQPAGDNTRIDWGYLYVAADSSQTTSAMGSSDRMLQSFIDVGGLPSADDRGAPRSAADHEPVLAFTFDLGAVGNQATERHEIIAYDEIWSIDYFGKGLAPYWRRNGDSAEQMLQHAEQQYANLAHKCEQFDNQLMDDLTTNGGQRYARIAALAYRQCLCACGLVADANKQPLLFTKENTSNGDIATVDVIFPMDPMLIFLSPTLAKASLVAVLDYGASSLWKFPCAPHDLGTYPVVAGRNDGGEAMPVEESGNILLLMDAIAHDDGNADFASRWWPALSQWANYLQQFGLDPEDQLCTDDFMGHLAHNSNLSIKAILALAAYGDLCRMRGDKINADKFISLARADAQHWMKVADDGGHTNLAFDKPHTWSQKYNLVWDRLLGLNIFPLSVAASEVAQYKSVIQPFGVPLDSRTRLTKTDWSIWSATLAENQADFQTLISPIYDFLDQTRARQPLADSYMTDDLSRGGMHARPVVGGVFIKMLANSEAWKKWALPDPSVSGQWAPFPEPRQQVHAR